METVHELYESLIDEGKREEALKVYTSFDMFKEKGLSHLLKMGKELRESGSESDPKHEIRLGDRYSHTETSLIEDYIYDFGFIVKMPDEGVTEVFNFDCRSTPWFVERGDREILSSGSVHIDDESYRRMYLGTHTRHVCLDVYDRLADGVTIYIDPSCEHLTVRGDYMINIVFGHLKTIRVGRVQRHSYDEKCAVSLHGKFDTVIIEDNVSVYNDWFKNSPDCKIDISYLEEKDSDDDEEDKDSLKSNILDYIGGLYYEYKIRP
jgi:hypothetical protein